MRHRQFHIRFVTALLGIAILATSCASPPDGTTDAMPLVDPSPTARVEPTLELPATPKPTPEPTVEPRAVIVDWVDEASAMSFRDRSTDWEGRPDWSLKWAGDQLTITMSGLCGDECSADHVLVLQDRSGEPEFIEYGIVNSEWDFELAKTVADRRMFAVERLVVHAWDRDAGQFAGQLFGADQDRPLFAFYFDPHGAGVLERLNRGENIPAEVLRSELTSGDFDRELDALLALDELRLPRPEFAAELLDLLAGGANAHGDVATHAALQLSKLLTDDTHVGLRRPSPAYWVVDFDEPTHIQQVRRNWESLLAVGTADGVVGRDLTDDESLIAGRYETFEFRDCSPAEWNESCGLALTLLCNGYAFWNEGVTIETAPWALRDGVLVFDGAEPILAGLVDPELTVGDWISVKREGFSDFRRCG